MTNSTNKRRFNRVHLDKPLIVEATELGPKGNKIIRNIQIVDLSVGGMKIISNYSFRFNSDSYFDLFGKHIKANIIWSENDEHGVSFILTDDDREYIREEIYRIATDQQRQSRMDD